jgi:plastocyanin
MRGGIARGALAAAALTLVTWIAAPAAMAGGGCFHHVTAGVGTGSRVGIVDMCFDPIVLFVDPGTKVTWTNHDSMQHTVSGVGGAWGTFGPLSEGDSVSYTFKDSGTYVYVCTMHIGMAGAVVVGDGTGAAGFDPSSVGRAALIAAPAAASGSGRSGGMSLGSVVGLLALGLAGAIGLWAIHAERRRRSEPQLTAR